MSFSDITDCPFCNTELQFRKVDSMALMSVGYCPSCNGIPMHCLQCNQKSIVEFRAGVSCPSCGNDDFKTCLMSYSS
jgi:ssDNA-binding Zn-finger/Zn-ribbon topoisomerase 1